MKIFSGDPCRDAKALSLNPFKGEFVLMLDNQSDKNFVEKEVFL